MPLTNASTNTPASGVDEEFSALLDCAWVELVTTGVLDCVLPVAELVWEPPFLESPPQADNTSARLNAASKWILIVLSLIVIVRPRFRGQNNTTRHAGDGLWYRHDDESIASLAILIRSARYQQTRQPGLRAQLC